MAEASGTLSVVDAAKKQVVQHVGIDPGATAVAADDQYVYLVVAGGQRVQVVRKADWKAIEGLASPEPLAGTLWVDRGGHVVYAPTQGGRVLAFNAVPGAGVAETLDVGAPVGPITGSSEAVYVGGGRRLTAIDLATGRSRAATLPNGPVSGLVYDGRTGLVWALTADHHLLVVDGSSLQVQAALDAPSAGSLAFDPGLRFMYAVGGGGFGSYDTNTVAQWAQVATAAPAASAAGDPVNHELYLYEPGGGQLAVYAWGVSGNGPVTGGGGGGTAPLGVGGGAAGLGGAGTTTTSGPGTPGASGSGAGSSATSGPGTASSGGAPGGASFGAGASGASTGGGPTGTAGGSGAGSTGAGNGIGATNGSGAGGAGSGGTAGSSSGTAGSGFTGASGGSGAGSGGASGGSGSGSFGASGGSGAGSSGGSGGSGVGSTGASGGSGAGSTGGSGRSGAGSLGGVGSSARSAVGGVTGGAGSAAGSG